MSVTSKLISGTLRAAAGCREGWGLQVGRENSSLSSNGTSLSAWMVWMVFEILQRITEKMKVLGEGREAELCRCSGFCPGLEVRRVSGSWMAVCACVCAHTRGHRGQRSVLSAFLPSSLIHHPLRQGPSQMLELTA